MRQRQWWDHGCPTEASGSPPSERAVPRRGEGDCEGGVRLTRDRSISVKRWTVMIPSQRVTGGGREDQFKDVGERNKRTIEKHVGRARAKSAGNALSRPTMASGMNALLD